MMAAEAHCGKHDIGPGDDEWKVLMEELSDPDERLCEPFVDQVCPKCFVALRDKYQANRRRLKTESRQAVGLRTRCDQLQDIVDAVVLAVKDATGKDAVDLAEKGYKRNGGGCDILGSLQRGELANILPNLIVEAANRGGKQ